MDVFCLVKMVVPVSPTKSWSQVWVYAPFGPRRGVLAWISSRLNAMVSREGARKILDEDAGIFAPAQRGMEASVNTGVIGRREERVWAFQDWVLHRSQAPGALRPVVAAPGGCESCTDLLHRGEPGTNGHSC
jgi:hypothetical protein